MARPEDPAARLLDTCAVAFSVDSMDQELDRLSMHGMVPWLGGNRPRVEPEVIRRAICNQFPVRPDDVTMVRHAPEDFFVDFKHRHHRDEAVAQGSFPYRNLDIHTRPWQLNESIAKRAVARACDIDYIEKASLDRADTRALCVWAWTHNPSDIPKVTWLTLSCRKAELHTSQSARGRRGLTFRVLVHLDLVEDPPARDGRAAAPRVYTWDYGVVDGERVPRDRHNPPPADIHGSRRDDDDDRRGCRERQGDNWYSRLTRSLSRAPKDRERERSASRHGGRRHRSPEHGGRRRPLHDADVAARHLAPSDTAGHGTCDTACLSAPSDTAGHDASTGAPLLLAKPAEPRRPGEVQRRARGRSRERTAHRRKHRRTRSETRNATPRSKSPSPRLRCKSPDIIGANGGNHHPSPSPPKAPTVNDHDNATRQRPHNLAAERRFRAGWVYCRRPTVHTPQRKQAQPTQTVGSTQVLRFRPGLVYSRRGAHETVANCQRRRRVTEGLQQHHPGHNSLSHAGTPEGPVRQPNPPQTCNRGAIPVRRSVRIVAVNWPRGDTQARARQVLMKKLGILDAKGLSHDEAMLRYFDLFKGPLTDDAAKALTALCGIDVATPLTATFA
ncbi:uncharacterized protein [Miscanthus floridulus]|uniref:uncharacterized protein n=1 Tax=Miscanthus floridulus TaxID=154761 RepID=UPI003458BDD5